MFGMEKSNLGNRLEDICLSSEILQKIERNKKGKAPYIKTKKESFNLCQSWKKLIRASIILIKDNGTNCLELMVD